MITGRPASRSSSPAASSAGRSDSRWGRPSHPACRGPAYRPSPCWSPACCCWRPGPSRSSPARWSCPRRSHSSSASACELSPTTSPAGTERSAVRPWPSSSTPSTSAEASESGRALIGCSPPATSLTSSSESRLSSPASSDSSPSTRTNCRVCRSTSSTASVHRIRTITPPADSATPPSDSARDSSSPSKAGTGRERPPRSSGSPAPWPMTAITWSPPGSPAEPNWERRSVRSCSTPIVRARARRRCSSPPTVPTMWRPWSTPISTRETSSSPTATSTRPSPTRPPVATSMRRPSWR